MGENMMKKEILLRSFMYVPAYNKKYIEKAVSGKADAIILDVEDSVPDSRKQAARDNLIRCEHEGLFSDKKTFIRINPIGTEDFAKDIFELTLKDIDGFMPSKIENGSDIIFIDRLLYTIEQYKGLKVGKYLLTPLIETTLAVASVDEIAFASKRLVALCFGGEDYLNDLGSVYTYQKSAFGYPRSKIVNAARAAGILPIDTPYLDISDINGFRTEEKEAYRNGFAGCLILNPKQIEAANEIFSPDDQKVSEAQNIIELIRHAKETNEDGVAMWEGRMMGPPMVKRAEMVLKYKKMAETYER